MDGDDVYPERALILRKLKAVKVIRNATNYFVILVVHHASEFILEMHGNLGLLFETEFNSHLLIDSSLVYDQFTWIR